jgi:hypothetical protein
VVFANPPADAYVALRGLPEKRSGARPYLIWIKSSAGREGLHRGVFDFVRVCNDRGLAAYCVPGFVSHFGRAGNADVVAIRVLVMDIDAGDIAAKRDRAVAVLGQPTLAVFSGGVTGDGQRKQHLYWTIAGNATVAEATKLWGMAARAFGGDASFDSGRAHQPIRIAGSMWRKEEPPRLVEVAEHRPESSVDLAVCISRLADLRIQTSVTNPANTTAYGLTASEVQVHGAESSEANGLGLSRTVPLDELVTMRVGHGGTTINRFEALTRMMGSALANIHDIDDPATIRREYGHFRQWAITHIENVERDYDLAQHWAKLLGRERWKRQQPRPPRARRYGRTA